MLSLMEWVTHGCRAQRNLSKLPEVTRKVEKLGLKDERAREVGRELREEDDPRLSDLLKVIDDIKNRAADALDDPKMAKSEIRKLVTPMLKNCVRDMNNWGDDYKDVMDKVNNLRPRGDGGKRQVRRGGGDAAFATLLINNGRAAHAHLGASQGQSDTATHYGDVQQTHRAAVSAPHSHRRDQRLLRHARQSGVVFGWASRRHRRA